MFAVTDENTYIEVVHMRVHFFICPVVEVIGVKEVQNSMKTLKM